MSKPTDPEWHDLMDAWQSEAPEETAPAPLSDEVRRRIRRKVKRHSYWLILLAVSEVVLAVGMTALMLFLLDFRRPADLFALIGTVVLFSVAFYYTVRNRRGTWWPVAESTTTFVDLSIERCRASCGLCAFSPSFWPGVSPSSRSMGPGPCCPKMPPRPGGSSSLPFSSCIPPSTSPGGPVQEEDAA